MKFLLHPLLRLLLVLALCGLPLTSAAQLLPPFGNVKAGFIPSDALLLDRNGVPLADRRFDPQVRRLAWVELQALPEAMREALLVAEDKRFFEHGGVDWMAFAGAVWQNLWGTRRGASTLTMQLAGLLDPQLALPNQGRERRSLTQKWDQGLAAIELEKHWSKPQILEAYLNLAPFRGDLQGIGAASEVLFGLPTAKLTRREAVILAALLRGPNARASLVAQRACTLAGKLGSARLCPDITRLAQSRLDAPRNQPRYALAPHLANRLLNERGQRVSSLLDAQLQQALLDAVRDNRAPQASAVLLDNTSGAVLAWIGAAEARAPDGVSASRLLGGWWWPHLTSLALEQGQLSAASLLPAPGGGGLPHNGVAPHSLRNVLATQDEPRLHALAPWLEPERVGERLSALGLTPAPALWLPGAQGEVSLLQLATAWRSLAAGGSFVAPRLRADDNGFRSLSGPDSAFVTLDMLASNGPQGWQAHWLSSGTNGDAVVVGSNARFTLAVATRQTGDARGAARKLWQQAFAALPTTTEAPTAPAGVEAALVVFEPPVEPARREWLLRGINAQGSGNASFHRVAAP